MFLAVPASALPACTPKTCTLADCSDGVDISVYATANLGALRRDGAIEVCRNDRCTTGAVVERGALSLKGETSASGWVSYVDDRCSLVTMRIELPRDARDGDRYRIVVKDDSGTVLVDEESVAKYEAFRPNGLDCEPECTRASLTFPSSVSCSRTRAAPTP